MTRRKSLYPTGRMGGKIISRKTEDNVNGINGGMIEDMGRGTIGEEIRSMRERTTYEMVVTKAERMTE